MSAALIVGVFLMGAVLTQAQFGFVPCVRSVGLCCLSGTRTSRSDGCDLIGALVPGSHQPLRGHRGGHRAHWHGHGHLGAYQVYGADVGASLGLSCALKPLARFVGLEVVGVDRRLIHELSDDERRAYGASDACLARTLIKRRAQPWAGVDQLPLTIGS